MITKYAPVDFSETRDSISWALIYAPEFKGERSLDEMFEDLTYGVNLVKAKTRSAQKLEVIERVLAKLAESKREFEAGNRKPAHHALYEAGQLFRSLRK